MRNTEKEIQILQTIKKAGLPVGAAYLAGELSIAPATIGRILTSAEEAGLVEKVSNKGRILTGAGEDFLARQEEIEDRRETTEKLVAAAAESDRDSLLEIIQVRRLLECYAAEQASLRATEEEVMELERLMLEHIQEIRTKSLGSSTDFRFHLAIARASKVRTIYRILKLILSQDDAYAKFSYVSDQLKNAQIKQHTSIVRAIQARNPEAAHQAMDSHLLQVMQDIESYYEQNQGKNG